MPNNYFKFKQFTIYQDKCAMKVGTDGVMLGAWANCTNATRALDVGAGTGLIALMLAQRSNAMIDAVEIDTGAFEQAVGNAENSPWKNRITIFHDDFRLFYKNSDTKYDLIVTNPPFFQNSLLAPERQRNLARHNFGLDYIDIIDAALKMLPDKGVLSLILPYLEGNMFILRAAEKGLYCSRLTKVLPKPSVGPKRLLIELMKARKPLVEQEIVIELNKRHQFSDAYKNLTKDFYLAF